MAIKEKLLGIILIIVGAIPFFSKIKSLETYFSSGILSYLIPGNIIYQIVLIAIGILLVWSMKPRQRMPR